MYVIETDAPCRHCEKTHGYVTQICSLAVWLNYSSARWVAKHIEGSAVREINAVPEDISYTLFVHKNGRPDPSLPAHASALSSG